MAERLDGHAAVAAAVAAIDRAIEALEAGDFSVGAGTAWGIVKSETWAQRNLVRIRAAVRALDASYTADEAKEAERRVCRCTGTDSSLCPIHTVDHFHRPGCCGAPEEAHRRMSRAEYEREFPRVFNEIFAVGDARYKVDARRYWSGVGVGLVLLFEGDDESGLVIDLPGEAARPVAERLLRVAELVEREGERG